MKKKQNTDNSMVMMSVKRGCTVEPVNITIAAMRQPCWETRT